jgi:hypothetical protein
MHCKLAVATSHGGTDDGRESTLCFGAGVDPCHQEETLWSVRSKRGQAQEESAFLNENHWSRNV